jgi:ketosteroid isomerase-like protein
MYRRFVERQVREAFRQLSEGDYETSVGQMPPELVHVFPGDHALGGIRRTPEGMRKWFGRLYQIFPDLSFEVKRVLVRGWPWDTTVAVEWVDRAIPPDGVAYVNEGTHLMRLQRGKLTYIHAHLDTQKVAEVCDRLAQRGMAEAAAPPIEE